MRRGVLLIVAFVGVLVLAVPAQANFHLMSVSEVFTDEESADGQNTFIELQMYASGQQFTDGKEVRAYGSDGAELSATTNLAEVANGDTQRTILMGDQDVDNRDFFTEDLSDMDAAAGAVCFVDPGPDPADFIDCVAWGTPSADFPDPVETLVGNPAFPGTGIPAGQSLTRSIAPNCPTLLEAADDTNDSATDFFLSTSPTPRPNSETPTEVACDGGPAPPLTDTDPPDTTITKGPKGTIEKDTVKFRFESDEPGSTFECKAPGKPFKKCSSPKKLKNLDEGKQKFKVRAIDRAGNVDATPAKRKFKVDAE